MCGVIGVVFVSDQSQETHSVPVQKLAPERPVSAADEVYRGLLTLQHRGQDAAGILSFDSSVHKFFLERNLGLVTQVFDEKNLAKLSGEMSIGHTRYATTGGNGVEDLQPMVTGAPYGIGIAHNGNLINYHSLVKEFKDEFKLQFLTNNDLEIFLNIIAQSLGADAREMKGFCPKKLADAAEVIFERTKGGYAIVGLIAGEGLFGMRDPDGIRPLVLGKKIMGDGKTAYALASENVSLNFLGYETVRDIAAGEFIFIRTNGELITYRTKLAQKSKAPCVFEWIYFAGAESTIEEKSVYTARLNLGKVLARAIKPYIESGEISPDIVCPVPDTSRTASIALAEGLGLPYREALIKNRYIQRSFILNSQEAREKAVELKLSPVRSEIEGKSLLLVDDSVVRGTTSKKIIDLLKRYGAKDVTLAVTCPPLRFACYYGIDFPSPSELIAGDRKVDEIASFIGAKKIIFLEESDLKEAIGLKDMCMACINKKYPTDISDASEFARMRRA